MRGQDTGMEVLFLGILLVFGCVIVCFLGTYAYAGLVRMHWKESVALVFLACAVTAMFMSWMLTGRSKNKSSGE